MPAQGSIWNLKLCLSSSPHQAYKICIQMNLIGEPWADVPALPNYRIV